MEASLLALQLFSALGASACQAGSETIKNGEVPRSNSWWAQVGEGRQRLVPSPPLCHGNHKHMNKQHGPETAMQGKDEPAFA